MHESRKNPAKRFHEVPRDNNSGNDALAATDSTVVTVDIHKSDPKLSRKKSINDGNFVPVQLELPLFKEEIMQNVLSVPDETSLPILEK